MRKPIRYDFIRYLAAKKTVDDRALNARVWQALRMNFPLQSSLQAPNYLEIGSGIGTMLERMLETKLIASGAYVGIDADSQMVQTADKRLPAWARQHGYQVQRMAQGFELHGSSHHVEVSFQNTDVFDFSESEEQQSAWDVLIAHAVLDLLPLSTAVPALLGLLRPGGLFYFSVNFDGVTIFEPAIDPQFDALVIEIYHQSMDERRLAGKQIGGSRTGRQLFSEIDKNEGRIIQAGASDWIVFPENGRYVGDEAYFLYHILYFFESSLAGRFGNDERRFTRWLAQRRAQVARGELIFIVHQLDFVGRVSHT